MLRQISLEVKLTHSLTHWGRATHICVGKLTIIGSDNGLLPGRRQAIIWTIAGKLLIRPLGTNFNEILIGIQTFSFKKMHWKMSSAKWRPFCLGLNVLKSQNTSNTYLKAASRKVWELMLWKYLACSDLQKYVTRITRKLTVRKFNL